MRGYLRTDIAIQQLIYPLAKTKVFERGAAVDEFVQKTAKNVSHNSFSITALKRAGFSPRAKIKQTVRKVAIGPKTVSQKAVLSDCSGSDRPEAAKIRLNPGLADQSKEFSHGLQDFCTQFDTNEINGLRGAEMRCKMSAFRPKPTFKLRHYPRSGPRLAAGKTKNLRTSFAGRRGAGRGARHAQKGPASRPRPRSENSPDAVDGRVGERRPFSLKMLWEA